MSRSDGEPNQCPALPGSVTGRAPRGDGLLPGTQRGFEVVGEMAPATDKTRDGRLGQGRHGQPADRGKRRQVTGRHPQRMAGSDLVLPVGHNDHGGTCPEAAAQEASRSSVASSAQCA